MPARWHITNAKQTFHTLKKRKKSLAAQISKAGCVAQKSIPLMQRCAEGCILTKTTAKLQVNMPRASRATE